MENNIKILIIEDDVIDARFIRTVLSSAGYDSDVAHHPNEALEVLNEHSYDLILVDLKMSDMGGMQILELVKRYYPATEVIIITAHASIDTAVEAIKLGAYSYFVKGDPARKLISDIKDIAGRKTEKNFDNPAETSVESSRLKTRGATFTSVLLQARKIASASMNVILVGTPGTGRKALAQHIGKSSSPKDGHAYEIDFPLTQELPHQTAKDELVNYLDQYGSAGTCIFLNIDQADPEILSDLLSTLETHIPHHSSGRTGISVISTSTSRSIPRLKVTYGSELFFHYWGSKTELPEMKERREDLPLVVEDFIEKLSIKQNAPTPEIDSSLIEHISTAFFAQEFEGLETLLQRLFEASSGAPLTSSLLEQVETDDILLQKGQLLFPTEPSSLKEARKQTEREFIKTIYDRSERNKSKTATALGISARQLYNMLKKYNLEKS
ncbi:sigma-54 dependent transcriptional regulator [Desulfovibrio sp. JC022]|uniref:sigma-54-dependent transcriptional regulator n=1 Tax=Desulfovibrio sp. JC022 TaxID=2593642 RepID=UPI0013D8514D|nr:response regulator [Desulfovibrio sp. JC022]NDV24533.1 sigma-54-dependent Fis family transcriptional regulator [Desulfovibrio sp. JC022]